MVCRSRWRFYWTVKQVSSMMRAFERPTLSYWKCCLQGQLLYQPFIAVLPRALFPDKAVAMNDWYIQQYRDPLVRATTGRIVHQEFASMS